MPVTFFGILTLVKLVQFKPKGILNDFFVYKTMY